MRDFDECRPFVEHMFSEHRHLAKQLLHVQTLFQNNELAGSQNELLAAVFDLKKELSRHFREEEEGGCLDEAIAHCPRIAAEADAILDEHSDLSEQIDRIVVTLKKSRGAKRCCEAAADFRSFAQRVLKHEARENKVMTEAFGTLWVAESGELNDQYSIHKPR